MKRSLRDAAMVAAVISVITAGSSTAQAQYGYPGGYGGYGWGGWGGGGATVQGNIARGLGAFAAGAGQYNEQTAIGNSINADTAMRWNEYVYESQLNVNRKYHEKLAREKYNNIKDRQKIYDQLRNNPQEGDIYSGEAMNLALDEINNPKVYMRSLDSIKAKVDGPSIRNIPFQYAAAAVTTSIHDIVHQPPPAILKKPEFADDLASIKDAATRVREKTDDGKQPDKADVEKVQEILVSVRKRLEAKYDYKTPGYAEGEKFLKAAYALTKMLQGPSMKVILAGSEKRKDATLGDLLNFMNSFNLRFGPATDPDQRAVYAELYPLLVKSRDEAGASIAAADPNAKANAAHPHDFFSGMKYDDLESKKTVPPPPDPQP